MLSSVMQRLAERRDGAADLGEDAGFTLIELMVVLLILAILLAIAIPTFLGVTGGANDRAAQSNLNTALTTVKAAAANNNQTYSGIATTQFAVNEPSLSWVTGAVTGQGPVSWTISGDGNGIVLASFSKNANGVANATGTCWYAADNQAQVTSSGWTGPTSPGVDYGHAAVVTGIPASDQTNSCTSTAVATGVSWSSTFSG